MVKRRITRQENGGQSYSVGYRKPPIHSQFRPGQSGNPKGRPKGVRNLVTDVKRTLMATVKVREAGRVRRRTTQESALLLLREKALQGDARALDRLLELAMRFNNEPVESTIAQALPADDQAILDAYVAERTGSSAYSQLPNSAQPIVTKRRRGSRTKG